MFYIPILLGSTRRGRQSLKAARFVYDRLRRREGVETEVLDLLDYNFPVMEERLRFRDDPPPGLREFAAKIDRADAIIVVSPEYNGGYPAALKNAIDYLLPEYKRKPFGIVTVSAGGFGGSHVLSQLRLVTLALGGFPIPAALPFSRIQQSLSEDGTPADTAYERRAQAFFDELLWFTAAIAAKKEQDRRQLAAD